MTLFISIASYCDPVLPFTLDRAVATAADPAALHFGVVEQVPPEAPRLPSPGGGARLSQVRIDPLDARGPCWARAVAMTLYDQEDWFLQLDSHMDFDPGWDRLLVERARALEGGGARAVISSYPNAFVFQDGQVVRKPTTSRVLAHVVKPGASFDAAHPVLPFEAHPMETDVPVRGFHVGAGCLFGPGTLAQAFPYDPHFYFHGEEQALALRLFTHGWDIFHVPGLPVHHLYNNAESGAPARPLHWDAAHDGRRAVSWWQLEHKSRQRLAALVAGDAGLGIYGLGKARSVADYAALSGIDYTRRTLEPRAHTTVGRT